MKYHQKMRNLPSTLHFSDGSLAPATAHSTTDSDFMSWDLVNVNPNPATDVADVPAVMEAPLESRPSGSSLGTPEAFNIASPRLTEGHDGLTYSLPDRELLRIRLSRCRIDRERLDMQHRELELREKEIVLLLEEDELTHAEDDWSD